MRCFTATAEGVREGLSVRAVPFPHIAVGSEGRGRQLVRVGIAQGLLAELGTVPCSARGHRYSAVFDPEPRCERCGERLTRSPSSGWQHPDAGDVPPPCVLRAGLIRTARGALLLVEPDEDDDARALVLLAVPAGFRGVTRVEAATPGRPCPLADQGYRSLYDERCPTCGAAMTPTQNGGYAHPQGATLEWSPIAEAGDDITLVATGHCAQGAAGRMGGHAEHLVIMRPGAAVRIARSGRLYGDPPVLIVRWDGAALSVATPEEEALAEAVATEAGERL